MLTCVFAILCGISFQLCKSIFTVTCNNTLFRNHHIYHVCWNSYSFPISRETQQPGNENEKPGNRWWDSRFRWETCWDIPIGFAKRDGFPGNRYGFPGNGEWFPGKSIGFPGKPLRIPGKSMAFPGFFCWAYIQVEPVFVVYWFPKELSWNVG